MTNILVTGAGGQLGLELARIKWPNGIKIVAVDRSRLDITDRDAVSKLLSQTRPAAVVNAAAYTGVDGAEDEADKAFAVNATAVGYLASVALEAGSALIHVSTDYVFDGTKDDWYVESDPITPLGVYGRSKAAGEAEAATIERHLILRTAWVYGALGSNFVTTMLRLADTRDELNVVNDQIGCPTSAADIAAAIVRIATRVGTDDELTGTYHLASPQSATWYEFAASILARQLHEGSLTLNPIPTTDYPTPAKRPANSRLDSTAIERAAGIRLPDWSESLPGVAAELRRRPARSSK